MFEFLQGLAFGLLMSCPPWFMAGMFDPRLATPEDLASRWQVILRYGFAVPLIGMSMAAARRVHPSTTGSDPV